MKIKARIFVAIVIALAFPSCRSAEFNSRLIDVNGMVYDYSNRPVPYCEVTIGKRYKSSTDINGRFTVPRVPAGVYPLKGNKKGFEGYVDEVIIKDRGQIIYFRIPSLNQLLNLVDEALTANNLNAAEEYAERAYNIDNNNIEMLFYYATVKFKQNDFHGARIFLEMAGKLGSRDLYIDRFLNLLLEKQNEVRTN